MNIITSKIIELLRNNPRDSRNIKRFYFGNPVELASADLLAIFVQPLSKEVNQLDNVNDEITGRILIGVCIDPAQYEGKKTDEATAERFLSEIEGGRNPDGSPIKNSIMYVLRNNFTLEGTSINQSHETIWGEREMTGGVAKEIHIYITVKAKVKNT